MKFEFECNICFKKVKRGDCFTVEIFKKESDLIANCDEHFTKVCKRCHGRIIKKIESMVRYDQ